ncbi:DEK domain-containing chromatin-associated protein 1-like [Bidens hawaiensis]|uniref:DEK domain-containing chromatin-associated protein 1-like n=1 Tax=Bidens hawaiensis TaxID=980011 RepID=UPI0040493E8F
MGDENMVEAVDNGTKSPVKSDNSGRKQGSEEMCDKTEDKPGEVKDDNKKTEDVIDENNKTEEKDDNKKTEEKDDNIITEEVKDDNKKTEDGKVDNKEENEVTDSKEEEKDERKEEAKSDAMEIDDAGDADEQHDDKVAESADSEEAGSKKHARKKSGGEKSKNKKTTEEKKKNDEIKTPVAPIIDRPVRERKSVERLVAIFELDAAKEFQVEKGRGTALKDIPNVAYKLSKKKVADETLKLLHTILFVKRGKAMEIKSNVLRFSGFVWHENEEKQKAKVHEKLDKLNKEKLLEFCDLLDIPITITKVKKDDVISKLIDFLLAPHATTSELLAEKEQPSKGSKRKRVNKKSASTPEATPSKDSSRKSKRASKEQKGTSETEDSEEEHEDGDNEHQNENGGPAKSQSEDEDASDLESVDEEEESNKRKRDSKKSSSKTDSASKTKSKKAPPPKKSNTQKKTPTTVESKSKDESESKPPTKTFSRKKKDHVVDDKTLTSKKSASKDKTAKKAVKEKETPKEEKPQPSDVELRSAIHETLKEADFNTATFLDILKLLNEQFSTDLTPRKASLKCMVKEELTKIADEDETRKKASV